MILEICFKNNLSYGQFGVNDKEVSVFMTELGDFRILTSMCLSKKGLSKQHI